MGAESCCEDKALLCVKVDFTTPTQVVGTAPTKELQAAEPISEIHVSMEDCALAAGFSHLLPQQAETPLSTQAEISLLEKRLQSLADREQ